MERKGVLYMVFNQLPSDYFLTKDQSESTPRSDIEDPSRYWLYCLDPLVFLLNYLSKI